jgi:hypothetical protein
LIGIKIIRNGGINSKNNLNNMLNTKILLGLTTTEGSNWQDKINEIPKLGIKEIAVLPETLGFEQRKQMYKKLEETSLESIPFVHLRNDMEQPELDYLVAKYKTKVFCVHTDDLGFKLFDRLPKYQSMIFMENPTANKSAIKNFNKEKFSEHQVSGICLDLSHLESQRVINKPAFKQVQSMLNSYQVGCDNISGVSTNLFLKLFHKKTEVHDLKSLDQLDYLRKFPKQYFAKYIIIELDNSFQEQIEIQKHLTNMLDFVIN